MRELAEAADLPRTTIHHYLREGLLPPPDKSAANAAAYGPEHLARLALLKALRGPEFGPLPIATIRDVLPLVERGLTPGAAVDVAALRRRSCALAGRAGTDAAGPLPADPGARLSLRELARRTGREMRALRALVDAGFLGSGGGAESFDPAEVAVAEACGVLLDAGFAPDDLRPVAALLREASAYEEALLDLAAADQDPQEAAAARESLRRAFRDLHAWLLAPPSAPETPGPARPS